VALGAAFATRQSFSRLSQIDQLRVIVRLIIFKICRFSKKKIHLLMCSTIKVRNGIQAAPQGRRQTRAEVGFELAIKRQPARRLDH
jgi:hypothetical protein